MKFSWMALVLFGTCLKMTGQIPGVTFIKTPVYTLENNPVVVKGINGGYLYTHSLTKSNPDSSFAVVTALNAGLTEVWSKVFKIRSNTTIANLHQAADGKITFFLNGNQTSSLYFSNLITLASDGSLLESKEMVDSSSASQSAPFFNHIQLQNGARWLFTTSSNPKGIVRMLPNGTVSLARQPIFGGQTNRTLGFSTVRAIPGTNQWIGVGNIANANLAFFMRMQDSTVLNFRVYNIPNSSSFLNTVQFIPNSTDVLVHATGGIDFVHLMRLTQTGTVVWKKSYAMPSAILSRSYVDDQGHIWLSGTTNPLVSGVIAHFSPTGDYIAHKCQFKLGFSLKSLTGFVQTGENEFFTMQGGYYNGATCLVANRINSSLNFKCFDYPIGPITDTVFNIVDSASTQLSYLPKRFGTKSSPSFPFIIRNQAQTTGNLTCVTTETSPLKPGLELSMFPNPVEGAFQVQGIPNGTPFRVLSPDGRCLRTGLIAEMNSVSDVPQGLYFLELPQLQLRFRFVKK